MMRLLIAMGLVAATLAPAGADEISIPLPDLTGDYQAFWEYPPGSGDEERSLTLTLPVEVTRIDQLRLAISGTWNHGLQGVTDPAHGFPNYFDLGAKLIMWLTIPGTNGRFEADIRPASSIFSGQTDVFDSCCPPGVLALDQLLGQVIQIRFFVGSNLCAVCWVEDDAYGTISDVQLQINGTTPTSASAWGEIKALYR